MRNEKVLAVITARGGSKRLPQKNLQKLGNETLLQRSVNASILSKCVDRIILSSDCSLIIKEAKNYGCDAPFVRPLELATDKARSEDVLEHAIRNVPGFDWVLLIQPTSPFRTAEDIDSAFSIVKKINRQSCVGVLRMNLQHSLEKYHLFNGDVFNSITQQKCRSRNDSKVNFALNVAIYLIKTSFFLQTKKLVNTETIGIEMSEKKSVDIDTYEDLKLATMLAGKEFRIK
jgi:CMP-N,N'-diacetyllegionaminic acid synthase